MSWLKRRKKQPGWLALGLYADRIDLVHVRRTVGGRPELALCDSFRKEGSDADTLSRLRKELKLEQYRCTTLLASNQYQIHQIDAPPVPPAEMKAAVRWRLKDRIDYPVETANVDVLQIPSGIEGATLSLYAVTASRDAVGRSTKAFADSHLSLDALDIVELAQRNVAALFEPAGEGIAMLAFYKSDALLTFTRGGELYLSRRVEVPLSELIQDDEEKRAEVFERVTVAIQRSLEHFEREHPTVGLAKLVIGPLPRNVGLIEHLTATIGGDVEAANLQEVMEMAAVPDLKAPERQAQFLPTIGAALREEAAAA
jgi:MSHA biogenesis protein MshI